jgi:hypothetical protein
MAFILIYHCVKEEVSEKHLLLIRYEYVYF